MSYKSQSDLYLEDNISKYPAIELLCKLGYQYISPEECVAQRGGLYDVILKDILRAQLHKLNQFTDRQPKEGVGRSYYAMSEAITAIRACCAEEMDLKKYLDEGDN